MNRTVMVSLEDFCNLMMTANAGSWECGMLCLDRYQRKRLQRMCLVRDIMGTLDADSRQEMRKKRGAE